jgi:GTPase SAR1 family protein
VVKIDPSDDLRRRQLNVDGVDTLVEFHDIDIIRSYPAFRETLLRDSDAAIMVYDITSRASFEHIKTIHYEVVSTKNSLKNLASKPFAFCIVGNKSDLSSERVVEVVEGGKLAASSGCHYWEISAMEGDANNCLRDVVKEIRSRQQHNPCSQETAKTGLLGKVKQVLRKHDENQE